MRTDGELEEAASHVAYEWRQCIAGAAQLAKVQGTRTVIENACLEAGLVHYRCLVNFCCGDYLGRWGRDDVQPADFLGHVWWPPDEELDRRLRGRLRGINKHLAHLTWDRLSMPVLWPYSLLAHEAHYAMCLFAAELPTDAPWRAPFDTAASDAAEHLPPRATWVETVVPLAPPR